MLQRSYASQIDQCLMVPPEPDLLAAPVAGTIRILDWTLNLTHQAWIAATGSVQGIQMKVLYVTKTRVIHVKT